MRLVFDDSDLPGTAVLPHIKPDVVVFSAAWEWDKLLPKMMPELGLINLDIKPKFCDLRYNCLRCWVTDDLRKLLAVSRGNQFSG